MPLCEAGHIPPDWTVADHAPRSATRDRCVEVEAPDPSPLGLNQRWTLCGGLWATAPVSRVPDLCPLAPGGLEIGYGPQPSRDYRPAEASRAFVLDCPGRYRARRVGDQVELELVDASPTACGPSPDEAPLAWGPDVRRRSLFPLEESFPEIFSALLPAPIRAGVVTDVDTWGPAANAEASGVVAWQTGPVALRVGELDLWLGHEVDWNAIYVAGTADQSGAWLDLDDVPVRVEVSRRLARGPRRSTLTLETWARMRLDTTGDALGETIAIRLPEARVCGVRIPAGGLARLSDGPAPTEMPACLAPPAAPPHDVLFGGDWAALEWHDVAPPAVPPYTGPPDPWRETGCRIVCSAPPR